MYFGHNCFIYLFKYYYYIYIYIFSFNNYKTLLRKLPNALIISGSFDLRIEQNLSILFSALKFIIFLDADLRRGVCLLMWCGHIRRQCISSSTLFNEHLLHNLFSIGIMGISCLPVSILRLCELHLNLAIFV